VLDGRWAGSRPPDREDAVIVAAGSVITGLGPDDRPLAFAVLLFGDVVARTPLRLSSWPRL